VNGSKALLPNSHAVEAALSQIANNHDTPFSDEVLRCFATLVREITDFEAKEPANADMLARAIYLSFWSGWRARSAADDETILKNLITG
jgi:hypothetical protein